MNSNLSISAAQPNFQAKVSKKFISYANNAFKRDIKNPTLKTNFDKKVAEFENFDYDDYIIKYVRKDIAGKRYHQLIAVRPSMDDYQGAILTSKDKFRKVIEKFTHINKHEFTTKMEQHRQKLFINYKPE